MTTALKQFLDEREISSFAAEKSGNTEEAMRIGAEVTARMVHEITAKGFPVGAWRQAIAFRHETDNVRACVVQLFGVYASSGWEPARRFAEAVLDELKTATENAWLIEDALGLQGAGFFTKIKRSTNLKELGEAIRAQAQVNPGLKIMPFSDDMRTLGYVGDSEPNVLFALNVVAHPLFDALDKILPTISVSQSIKLMRAMSTCIDAISVAYRDGSTMNRLVGDGVFFSGDKDDLEGISQHGKKLRELADTIDYENASTKHTQH